jgi:hypothetical protein
MAAKPKTDTDTPLADGGDAAQSEIPNTPPASPERGAAEETAASPAAPDASGAAVPEVDLTVLAEMLENPRAAKFTAAWLGMQRSAPAPLAAAQPEQAPPAWCDRALAAKLARVDEKDILAFRVYDDAVSIVFTNGSKLRVARP